MKCKITRILFFVVLLSFSLNVLASGGKITLNFQNISVRAALQILAQFAHINIVVSDSVTGHLTMNLQQIPGFQALNIILQTKGLSKRSIGNTLIVAPITELAKQINQAPLHFKLIPIHYGDASEIVKILEGSGKKILSERGNVTVDTRTNALLIQDTQEKIKEIKKLVSEVDVPVKQVLIKARIVNIDKNFEKDLGIRWSLTQRPMINNVTVPVDYKKRLNVDLPAAGVGEAGGAASFGLALAELGDHILLDMELSALQQENCARVIASPRLITANRTQAVIEAGQEIPYQEAAGDGTTAVSFKKAVLSLKVRPQITPDNRIILALQVNQDSRGADVLVGVPAINTREIQTQVLINDGQTIVLGGIYQKNDRDEVARVPLLSDIPLLGELFKHKLTARNTTELLIFITPKIINYQHYH